MSGLTAAALATALSCGGASAPADTLLTFAQQESGLHPYFVHDNATGASRDHDTQAAALATARAWLSMGGSVDVGLLQVSFTGPARNGMTLAEALTPCASARGGAAILAAAYAACNGGKARTLAQKQSAMTCAAWRYNASPGNPAGGTYAVRIWRTAAQIVPSMARLIGSGGQPAADAQAGGPNDEPPGEPCPPPDPSGWHVTAAPPDCPTPCPVPDPTGWHVAAPVPGCQPGRPPTADKEPTR